MSGSSDLHSSSHIAPFVERLKPGAKVLEVGSGSGILLPMLTHVFPDIELTGLEPFGDGFVEIEEMDRFFEANEVSALNLHVAVHSQILDLMIDRTEYDAELQSRQRVMGRVARLVRKAGLTRIFELPLIRRFIPYLKLEITVQDYAALPGNRA